MKVTYNETDDILLIEFSEEKIVKDVSHEWNIHVGHSESGIAEITVLDAKKTIETVIREMDKRHALPAQQLPTKHDLSQTKVAIIQWTIGCMLASVGLFVAITQVWR